jgi:hypothetical protein
MSAALGLLTLAYFWDPPPPPPPSLLELWTPTLVWASGWLGFCLSLINTQTPTKRATAAVQTLNNLTYVLHYGLVGAWSGLATQVLAATNGLLTLGGLSGSSTCLALQRITPLALIPLGAYTYQRPSDLLPLSAVATRLISFQFDGLTMRMIQLLALMPWIPYAVILDSTPALMTVLLSVVLQLLAIYTNHLSAAAQRAEKKAK